MFFFIYCLFVHGILNSVKLQHQISFSFICVKLIFNSYKNPDLFLGRHIWCYWSIISLVWYIFCPVHLIQSLKCYEYLTDYCNFLTLCKHDLAKCSFTHYCNCGDPSNFTSICIDGLKGSRKTSRTQTCITTPWLARATLTGASSSPSNTLWLKRR